MYFTSFPRIPYDSSGNDDFKTVTNLLKRVATRVKISQNTAFFDTYDVKNGETPEMIAHKLYGDPELHWVILLMNDVVDRYHQWPMSTRQFLAHLNDKYTNVDGVHHYEVSQTSGDTTIRINIGTDTTGYSEADLTTITNREYEQELQDELRQVKLLDPAYIEDFVNEFENLMSRSVL
tara:strand:- start:806 stop:1339 length:534 start_codon:yes stop_codon:yes gene_type:complete